MDKQGQITEGSLHTIFILMTLFLSEYAIIELKHTVVWLKLVVGNIHEKNFRSKKFSS